MGLEASMTKLGGGIDELQVDLLQGTTTGLYKKRLQETGNKIDGKSRVDKCYLFQ